MSILSILCYIFYGIIAIVLVAVTRTEWRAWTNDRSNPERRTSALHRLWRRGTGMVVLVIALALLRYPPESNLSREMLALKALICLLLCVALFVLALWDLRTIRHQMKHEVKDFLDTSSAEFEQYLQEHLKKKEPRPNLENQKSTQG
jgi:hypothetical protein